jgi:uncharacterized protein YkwD
MADLLRDWYYLGYNWRGVSILRGPFTTSEIHELLRVGEIDSRTRVRFKNKGPWLPLGELPTFSKRVVENEAHPRLSRFWAKKRIEVIVCATALICFALIAFGRISTSFHAALPGNTSLSTPSREVLTRESIIDLTNTERARNRLPPLKENRLLDTIAELRARDMLEKQYFAHVSPTGQQASDLAQSVGYAYKRIAENIGSGLFLTNRKIVDGWMQSPGHRKSILSAEVEEIGAAVVRGRMNGEETHIAVQIFGLESPPVHERSCVAPSQELLKGIELKNGEIAGLNERLLRLKAELEVEKASIEADRNAGQRDLQDRHNFNVRMKTYAEKAEWYNATVAEANGKTAAVQSMAQEYNKMLQDYRDCTGSK